MRTRNFLNSVVVAIIAIVLGMVFVACSGNELEVEPKGENNGGNNGHGDGHLDANVDTVYLVSSEIVANSREVEETSYGRKVSYNRKNVVRVKYNAEEDNFHFDTTVMSTNILNIYIPAKRDVYRKDLVFKTDGPTETRWDEADVKVVNNAFNFDGTKENIKLTSETQSFSFAGKQVIFPEITWKGTEFMTNENTFVKDSVIGDREFQYHNVALTFMSDLSDYTSEQYDALLGVFTTEDGYIPGGDEDDPQIIFNAYEHLRDTLKNETNLFAKFTKIQIWNDGRNERKEIEIDLLSEISGQAEEIHEQEDAIIRFGETRTTSTSEQYQNGFVTGELVTTTHTTYFGSWANVVTTKILSNAVYDDGDIKVNLGEKKFIVSYVTASQTASSYEVMKDGKKYNRYPYTLKYLASVSVLNHEINNSVLIDVEKEEIVEKFSYRDENLIQYKEGNDWYAEFTQVTISSLHGEIRRDQIKRNLNVFIEAQPELTKRQSTNSIFAAGETSKTTERDFTDGNFSGKTVTTVYTFNYDGGNWNHNITAKYDDVVYKKGNLVVKMSEGMAWTVAYSDYAQSAATQVTVGGEVYNRYPSVLNYIGTFNGVSETVKQNVNIDVLVPFEKNIPAELGEILGIDVTKVVSSIVNNVPTFRVHVGVKGEHGVLSIMVDEINNNSFPTNKIYMYGVDINKPTGIVSAALKTNDSRGWIPANILINDGADYRNGWTYKAYTDENYTQLIGQRVVNMMTGEKTPMINHSASKQADGSWIVKVNGSQVLRIK